MRTLVARALDLVGDAAPVVLIATVILVVSADVIGRSVFGAPLFAAHELSVIAFVWLVWLGAVGAARRRELIGVRYFVERLPPPLTRAVDIAMDLLIAAICIGVLWAGIRQIGTARFTTFDLLGLPKWILTLGLALGMGLIAAIHVARAVERFRRSRTQA